MRSHLYVPQLLSGEPVEPEHVRVIAHHEHLVAADRGAAIGAGAAFAENAFVPRFAVRPDLTSGRCVERVELVPSRDVHDAVLNNGRYLKQALRVRNWKHPSRSD